MEILIAITIFVFVAPYITKMLFPKKSLKENVMHNDVIMQQIVEEEKKLKEEKIKNEQLEKTLSNLYSQLGEYKKNEHKEVLRKIELQKLKDPKVVNEQLDAKGTVICFEGTSAYDEIITKKGLLGKKVNLDIKLKYNFGISMDWSTIKVKKINETSITLDISKENLKLQYVELDGKESETTSNKTLLVKDFEPEFVSEILKRAEEITRKEILSNKDYFEQAFKNLRMQLINFASELGCNSIVY